MQRLELRVNPTNVAAYEGLQAVIATSKNPKSMMKMYAGVRHGVEMFRDHPELPAVITSWLEEVLGKDR